MRAVPAPAPAAPRLLPPPPAASELPPQASLGPVETGHGPVDAALARLGELDGVPVEAHAEVYEGVHQVLRDTLKGLDEPRPNQ
ncbi:hypothetical protein [Streptacidiphilus cavernicola]|uniref:Uncharacterized protein n=1 Tax=Streptacidiphilus cavernicola TaxID=3342716 RepID=A0ABV6W3V8_9ACTN